MTTATLPTEERVVRKKRVAPAQPARKKRPQEPDHRKRRAPVPTARPATNTPKPRPQPVIPRDDTPAPTLEPPRSSPANPPERQAVLVKRAVVPASMATALGLDNLVGAAGYRLYLDELLRDAGNPTDPVEIMLFEQMAFCHLQALQLHGEAAEAKGLEATELYLSAAARLTAETRKIALALKEYRGK